MAVQVYCRYGAIDALHPSIYPSNTLLMMWKMLLSQKYHVFLFYCSYSCQFVVCLIARQSCAHDSSGSRDSFVTSAQQWCIT